jgi:hypothetical protein
MSHSRAIVPYDPGRAGYQRVELPMNDSGNSGALYDYYTNNEDIVRNDSVVRTLLLYLSNYLFAPGIQFMRGETILKNAIDFDPNDWVPFLYDSMPFIVAHGALVFYIYVDPATGVGRPCVPEWTLITMKDAYHEKTMQPIVQVEWKDPRRKEELHVFNSGNQFGRKPSHSGAPIETIKPLLRQYYHNLEMHTVSKVGNSRPPIWLESQIQQRDPALTANELGAFDSELERQMIGTIKTRGLDQLFVHRIREAASSDNTTYQTTLGRDGQPGPWWQHANRMLSSPPESRFMYIPHGLKAHPGEKPYLDGNFSKEQSELLQAIYNAFGVPYSAILSTSSLQSNKGVEMHETMLVNTLRSWYRLYSTVLTDVYRLIYDAKGVPVTVSDGHGDPVATKKPRTVLVYTTVHLRAAFITTPDKVDALYDGGTISFDTKQDMALESLCLPISLADRTVDAPLRKNALTQKQMEDMNMKAKLQPGTSQK